MVIRVVDTAGRTRGGRPSVRPHGGGNTGAHPASDAETRTGRSTKLRPVWGERPTGDHCVNVTINPFV